MSSRTPTLAEVIRTAIQTRLCDVHTMLPGKIDKYNADTQKADVKPLVRRLQKALDGEISESLPIIPDVPVAWPRSGAHRITMPVNEGDFCMLVFSESSIDAYQAGEGQEVDPGTFQRFDLSDAVALMGWAPDGAALGSTDADDLSIGEEDGPVIHIGRDLVNLYEKDATDFVALALKCLDENDRIKGDLDDIKTYMDALIVVLKNPVNEVGNGSPSVFQAAILAVITLLTYPTPTSTSSVAAEKVKAT